MPHYIPAYDTEAIFSWWETGEKRGMFYEGEPLRECVAGIRAVAEVHLEMNLPATFFLVARLLDAAGPEIKAILDQPLFDIQSHTYTHPMLREEMDEAVLQRELADSKRRIEDAFGRPVIGLTGPGGYVGGFAGCEKLLRHVWGAGYRYIRTAARGRDGGIPAPLTQPFWYTQDGYPELLELAAHAWHDNILTGQRAMACWPPVLPWGYPSRPARTALEVFEAYAPGVDYAVENGLLTYVPCFHPWSIYRVSHRAEHIAMLLRRAREKMTVSSCTAMYECIRKDRHLAAEIPEKPA